MTTAHRPTWKAAVGKSNEGGWTAGGAPSAMRSALSLPGHTKLKTRRDQDTISNEREEILKKSLKKLRDMEDKKLGPRVIDERVEEEGRRKLLLATADVDDEELKKKYDDADDDGRNVSNGDGWSDVEDIINQESDLDASDSDDDSDDSDDESDEEDEEAALQAELAKIRAEREATKAKADAEAAAEEQSQMEEAALVGNPLLDSGPVPTTTTGKLKRRWNEDVVFRNQAKNEPEQKKRFINDTVRNDFHKRFLNKFMK
jgi:protein CWC15